VFGQATSLLSSDTSLRKLLKLIIWVQRLSMHHKTRIDWSSWLDFLICITPMKNFHVSGDLFHGQLLPPHYVKPSFFVKIIRFRSMEVYTLSVNLVSNKLSMWSILMFTFITHSMNLKSNFLLITQWIEGINCNYVD